MDYIVHGVAKSQTRLSDFTSLSYIQVVTTAFFNPRSSFMNKFTCMLFTLPFVVVVF